MAPPVPPQQHLVLLLCGVVFVSFIGSMKLRLVNGSDRDPFSERRLSQLSQSRDYPTAPFNPLLRR
jgi:hypothetical protein